MNTPLPFHLTETPLTRGVSLIEASAGTGKTYAITALFVRLIVEENLSVREILAVTYTEAATGLQVTVSLQVVGQVTVLSTLLENKGSAPHKS